jgi:hypothetical protein
VYWVRWSGLVVSIELVVSIGLEDVG